MDRTDATAAPIEEPEEPEEAAPAEASDEEQLRRILATLRDSEPEELLLRTACPEPHTWYVGVFVTYELCDYIVEWGSDPSPSSKYQGSSNPDYVRLSYLPRRRSEETPRLAIAFYGKPPWDQLLDQCRRDDELFWSIYHPLNDFIHDVILPEEEASIPFPVALRRTDEPGDELIHGHYTMFIPPEEEAEASERSLRAPERSLRAPERSLRAPERSRDGSSTPEMPDS